MIEKKRKQSFVCRSTCNNRVRAKMWPNQCVSSYYFAAIKCALIYENAPFSTNQQCIQEPTKNEQTIVYLFVYNDDDLIVIELFQLSL